MNLAPAMANRIELWPLERLVPYARNARTHSESQVARIAASMVEFGVNAPLLVDKDGGLVAGHGRLLAAQKLGLAEVPVVVLDHLTPLQRRAYIIADNRLTELGGWDEELLAAEMEDLKVLDFDLELMGFDDVDLARLMSETEASEKPDGEAASEAESADTLVPPAQPASRPGDVWIMGAHRLICGNAGDAKVVADLMAGERADLCFTSPPYGQQRDYTKGMPDWDSLMQGVFSCLPMAEDGQVLVNLGIIHREKEVDPYWDRWITWMRAQGWRHFAWYVWDQGPGLPGDWAGRLAPAFEFVFHFNRQGSPSRRANKIVPCKNAGGYEHLRVGGTGDLRNRDGTKGRWTHVNLPTQDFRIPDSVIRMTRHKGPIGRDIDHPAVFPVGLPAHIMLAYTDEGDICFEPFCGSGSSILAGQGCGRRVRAVEIAPEYVDVAVKRFRMRHPDIPAVLESTGQTFEDVTAERVGAESSSPG